MMMMTSVWFEKDFFLPCGDHQDPSIQAPRKSPEQRFSLQYFCKKRKNSVIKVKHSQLSFRHCNCNQCQEHHFMGNKVCVWAIVHSKYGN